MTMVVSTSPAYCCYTTLGNISLWFLEGILANLIHQNAAKTILELEDG